MYICVMDKYQCTECKWEGKEDERVEVKVPYADFACPKCGCLCKQLEIRTDNFITDDTYQARYNPRVQPNWLINGNVVDGKTAQQIHTIDRGVFLTCG